MIGYFTDHHSFWRTDVPDVMSYHSLINSLESCFPEQ
jgi:hypothetical protein